MMTLAAPNRDRLFFPMLVSLAGRKCVVIGAGKIAAAKIEGLLACGASVTVVSLRAMPVIQSYAREGVIVWRRKGFQPRDLDRAFLAVAATNSTRINARAFHACAKRGVLCNCVDDPKHCDFIYPAVVRRGPLQIAISTGGRSPTLAARLRRELENQFSQEWGGWVEELGKQRAATLSRRLSAQKRKRLALEMVSVSAFSAFMRKQRMAAMKSRKKSDLG